MDTSPTYPSPLSQEQLDSRGYTRILPPHSSGISIIIVGCGFAGLSCAIESVRKGHRVVVLEKYKQVKMLGDVSIPFLERVVAMAEHYELQVISFNINVGRFFMRWGLHDK